MESQQRPSIEASELLEHLTEVEGVAEDILSCRREIIDLDRQRHKTNEAIRSLQKQKNVEKVWLCAGGMFLKVEKPKAVKMLSKDYDILEKEINAARSSLKPKVNKLKNLENKDELRGFNLNPLTPEEKQSVESILI